MENTIEIGVVRSGAHFEFQSSDRYERIARLLQVKKQVTAKDISEILGIATKLAIRHLDYMVKVGKATKKLTRVKGRPGGAFYLFTAME